MKLMLSSRRIAVATVATAAVFSGMIVSTGTANATSFANRCGSGYGHIKSWPIKDGSGSVRGYIDIFYNGGYNCAIARPSGTGSNIKVSIKRSNQSGWSDKDGWNSNYTSYAGPVYVAAKGSCIDFNGGFKYNRSTIGNSYWDKHCG